jgi:hypothetical protein
MMVPYVTRTPDTATIPASRSKRNGTVPLLSAANFSQEFSMKGRAVIDSDDWAAIDNRYRGDRERRFDLGAAWGLTSATHIFVDSEFSIGRSEP